MGKEFGNLAYIRGVICYKLSPFELKPFAKAFRFGFPNFFTRASATAMTWLPAGIVTVLVYHFGESSYKQMHRKNPKDYASEVDPNAAK